MVHRYRGGLGDKASCVQVFEAFRPYAEQLAAWQSDFHITSPDWMALGIAWDGLQTTAYHFTRRRYFFDDWRGARLQHLGSNSFLKDRAEAVTAFQGLTPFVGQFRKLMEKCPPYGRDWLALMISVESLETAAMHFTQVASFYGAKGDSSGPTGPQI